jgi:ribosomal protein L32E
MVVKKSHPTFAVPNYGAKKRKRVKERWRKQRGMDNKKRIKRSGYGATPKIGYKNSDTIRHLRPDGTFEFLIHNEKELNDAMLRPGTSVRFANGVSIRKKQVLQKIADSKGVNVVNRVKI